MKVSRNSDGKWWKLLLNEKPKQDFNAFTFTHFHGDNLCWGGRQHQVELSTTSCSIRKSRSEKLKQKAEPQIRNNELTSNSAPMKSQNESA